MTGVTRNEVGSADLDVIVDGEDDYPMAVPAEDDVTVFDLGDLVLDRVEANGRVTMPDEAPARGERESLGTVHWDANGIPTRLVREDDVVYFTEGGGFDRLEEVEG